MMNFLTQIIDQLLSYSENKPLIFTHLSFWIFFTILLAGYSLLYKRIKLRNFYLLLFSIFFYYKTSGLFFILLIFSTVSDYLIAFRIEQSQTRFMRKLWVTLSIFINLSLLSYFKYAYLIIDLVNRLFDTNLTVVNHLATLSNTLLNSHFDPSIILLPVGISFYTFQTISYTVDIYRKKLKPQKSFIDFAFFVSFFPQLVAGPIVRASEFIPQLKRKYQLNRREFGHALYLILGGLIKKMVISDYLSINLVDRIFDSPLSYSGFENLTAIYGYTLQIYCDFSGYTDIAIGIALILGFRLPINFNSPYKATSITDFWHRWHISLSTWLRDYLYIPLGGNRKGKLRTNINLMITMLLGGLWHGASIKFIIWGGIHGIALIIEKAWKAIVPSLSNQGYSPWKTIVSRAITLQLICITWIFFRAESLNSAIDIFHQLFNHFGTEPVGIMVQSYGKLLTMIAIGFAIHWLPFTLKERIKGLFIESHTAVKIAVTVAAVLLIIQFQTSTLQPFIYFRF